MIFGKCNFLLEVILPNVKFNDVTNCLSYYANEIRLRDSPFNYLPVLKSKVVPFIAIDSFLTWNSTGDALI